MLYGLWKIVTGKRRMLKGSITKDVKPGLQILNLVIRKYLLNYYFILFTYKVHS